MGDRTHKVTAVAPRAYRDRQPRSAIEGRELARLLESLEQAGVTVWLDGGWGVDALLGEQTREHDDVDFVVDLVDVPHLIETLGEQGYELVAGGPPRSFVLVDAAGRQVDVHPVAFDDAGGGVYQMDDGRSWVYPAPGFAGRGLVEGRAVRCLSAEVQVLVHDGYELTDKDYRELRLLRGRFGVSLPRAVEAELARGRGAA